MAKPNTSDFTKPKKTSYGLKNSRAPSQKVAIVSAPLISATTAAVTMPTVEATT